jgi:hypothetical protein
MSTDSDEVLAMTTSVPAAAFIVVLIAVATSSAVLPSVAADVSEASTAAV